MTGVPMTQQGPEDPRREEVRAELRKAGVEEIYLEAAVDGAIALSEAGAMPLGHAASIAAETLKASDLTHPPVHDEWVTAGPSADELISREVLAERARQDAKWGEQNHPDYTGPKTQPLADLKYRKAMGAGRYVELAYARDLAGAFTENTDLAAAHGTVTWTDILLEEVFEALAESDPARLRTELIQVAAVAQQWITAIDRRTALAAETEPTDD